jgi:hypothetical protein
MAAPAGFHEIRSGELENGRFLVANDGDGTFVYVEVEGGPFHVQDAKAIREALAYAVDVLPEMYSERYARARAREARPL